MSEFGHARISSAATPDGLEPSASAGVCGDHLVDAVGFGANDPLGRRNDLRRLGQQAALAAPSGLRRRTRRTPGCGPWRQRRSRRILRRRRIAGKALFRPGSGSCRSCGPSRCRRCGTAARTPHARSTRPRGRTAGAGSRRAANRAGRSAYARAGPWCEPASARRTRRRGRPAGHRSGRRRSVHSSWSARFTNPHGSNDVGFVAGLLSAIVVHLQLGAVTRRQPEP